MSFPVYTLNLLPGSYTILHDMICTNYAQRKACLCSVKEVHAQVIGTFKKTPRRCKEASGLDTLMNLVRQGKAKPLLSLTRVLGGETCQQGHPDACRHTTASS